MIVENHKQDTAKGGAVHFLFTGKFAYTRETITAITVCMNS